MFEYFPCIFKEYEDGEERHRGYDRPLISENLLEGEDEKEVGEFFVLL